MSDKIAFVGVGRMGANMARRLYEKGFTITAVYDAYPESAAKLAKELRCAAPETLAEVTAAADVIITVVTDDAAMRGIFGLTAPGKTDSPDAPTTVDSLLIGAAGKLFINCATVTPVVHVEVETAAAGACAATLEACMASSITQARQGTLYLMCAGQKAGYDRALPILEILSGSLRYVGETGSAAKVKALVNMVMNINTAGLAEGLGLGSALGLDLTMLREVFSQTGAASRVLQTDGEDMQNRDHACFFSASHAAKDSGIALELALDQGMDLPLAEATKAQYDKMVQLGLGELDKSGIAELTFPGRAPIRLA
ncbi:MAG: NAD(P)-dependent oxidoreductase [Candidatus Methylacidiphilales bacterium]|nr:NAD(P)-dependent oxidoreductase [Candidatus Methylacidiphilales bacterium]